MPVFGTGGQSRAFSDIYDVAPYIAKSPTIPEALGEVFNIGADKPCTVNTLAELVAEAMGSPCRLEHRAARNEVVHAFATHEKFRQVFNPGEAVSLRDGLQRMADWAKHVGPRQSESFSCIEIAKNLPDSWKSK